MDRDGAGAQGLQRAKGRHRAAASRGRGREGPHQRFAVSVPDCPVPIVPYLVYNPGQMSSLVSELYFIVLDNFAVVRYLFEIRQRPMYTPKI